MTRTHIICLILGLAAGVINLVAGKWEVAAWALWASFLVAENAMLYRQIEVERATEPLRSEN